MLGRCDAAIAPPESAYTYFYIGKGRSRHQARGGAQPDMPECTITTETESRVQFESLAAQQYKIHEWEVQDRPCTS